MLVVALLAAMEAGGEQHGPGRQHDAVAMPVEHELTGRQPRQDGFAGRRGREGHRPPTHLPQGPGRIAHQQGLGATAAGSRHCKQATAMGAALLLWLLHMYPGWPLPTSPHRTTA